MPKLTQPESNRINGRKSRGPKTPEGRAKSALNAVKHGLTAKTLILQNEKPAHLRKMLNSYTEYLRPSNPIEIDMVTEMVAARWRIRRIWRYETAMLDIEMDAQAAGFEQRFLKYDEDMRGAQAWEALAGGNKGMATAFRYEVHLSRVYRRILAEFQKIAKRTQISGPSEAA